MSDITLPDDVMAQVEAVSGEDGVSVDAIIRKAVEDYLFLRRFRELRENMMNDLERRGISLADENVFETERTADPRPG